MSKRTQLLEAIAALPEELVDQTLIYVQMLQNPIQITLGVWQRLTVSTDSFAYYLNDN